MVPVRKTEFAIRERRIPPNELNKLLFGAITGNAWLVLIYADLQLYVLKYGVRALRYVYLEAGHMCQELIRASQRRGLVGCPFGAFDDAAAGKLVFEVGCTRIPIYMLAMGYP